MHVVTCAEVPGDDDFVFEFVFSINEIIQMHVPVLADQFFTMIRRDESHFGDQNFGLVKQWVIVQTFG